MKESGNPAPGPPTATPKKTACILSEKMNAKFGNFFRETTGPHSQTAARSMQGMQDGWGARATGFQSSSGSANFWTKTGPKPAPRPGPTAPAPVALRPRRPRRPTAPARERCILGRPVSPLHYGNRGLLDRRTRSLRCLKLWVGSGSSGSWPESRRHWWGTGVSGAGGVGGSGGRPRVRAFSPRCP